MATEAAFSASVPVPRALGRLLLLKLIARGGMGDVFLAATTGIEGAERAVVVKTVRRDHIHDGSFLARFLDEARVQSQLNHPGVAQVLEATTDENGEPFTVVEHVEGRSLADVRQRAMNLGTRVAWPEAVSIALEMAQALSHVHERLGPDGTPLGIVHRDLSPQNVMIGYAGEVKLIDFGTARGHNRRCHTVAGVVFAKPGYVAPEIARQQVGDGRIDVYALGIMLWELVTGRRYLTGEPQTHLEQAAAGTLIVPRIAAEVGAPAQLDVVIDRLTVSDPEKRYTGATAATELARVLSEAPTPKAGERGIRARVAQLMRSLFPNEPGRSRSDFARLLSEARKLSPKPEATPSAPGVSLKVAEHMNGEGGLLPGTSYRLVRRIGEGASGTVWAAEHTELGRTFAIKVLAPEHGSSPGPLERFRREARVLAALSHPNLAYLHDFGRALDGRMFLVMELLEGETLDVGGRRPWRECLELGMQIASALEAAHSAGLVHRDLKPHNLFLTKTGTVKLLDFGVAVALSDAGEAEKPRGFAIFGTPEYMAPEQISGEPVDGRADLYALGCVLYELMTGERPFEGPSSVVVLGKQLREEPIAPRARVNEIPSRAEAIVLRALCKQPAERYASAAEMRAAMKEMLDGSRSRGWLRGAPRVVALAALAGAMVVGLGAAAVNPPRPMQTLSAAEPAPRATALVTAPAPAPPTPDTPSIAVSALPVAKDKDGNQLDTVRSAARAHPADSRKLKAWAHAARSAGELRESRRAADAWALHDGTAEPKVFLAQLLDQMGKRMEARAVLEEVLEKYPDSADARRLHAKLGATLPDPHRTAQR